MILKICPPCKEKICSPCLRKLEASPPEEAFYAHLCIQVEREARLAKALSMVAQKYPTEVDVQAYHLVAKTATMGHPRCYQHPQKCAQEIDEIRDALMVLIREHPTHTGVMHYILHAFDSPPVFREGNKKFLKKMEIPFQQNHQAFAAVKIGHDLMSHAKSVCHALHMPSHLYLRFGNWTGSANSNFLSVQVKQP